MFDKWGGYIEDYFYYVVLLRFLVKVYWWWKVYENVVFCCGFKDVLVVVIWVFFKKMDVIKYLELFLYEGKN